MTHGFPSSLTPWTISPVLIWCLFVKLTSRWSVWCIRSSEEIQSPGSVYQHGLTLISALYNWCYYLSMPGLKLNHVSKRGPCFSSYNIDRANQGASGGIARMQGCTRYHQRVDCLDKDCVINIPQVISYLITRRIISYKDWVRVIN